jgi:hypothetical protein
MLAVFAQPWREVATQCARSLLNPLEQRALRSATDAADDAAPCDQPPSCDQPPRPAISHRVAAQVVADAADDAAYDTAFESWKSVAALDGRLLFVLANDEDAEDDEDASEFRAVVVSGPVYSCRL